MAARTSGCSQVGGSAILAKTADIATRMAVRGGISVGQAQGLCESITGILRDSVAEGQQVRLPALGKMRTTVLRGEAWDPKQKKKIPRETRVVRFKGQPLEAES